MTNENHGINGPITNSTGLTYFTLHVILSYSSYIFMARLSQTVIKNDNIGLDANIYI